MKLRRIAVVSVLSILTGISMLVMKVTARVVSSSVNPSPAGKAFFAKRADPDELSVALRPIRALSSFTSSARGHLRLDFKTGRVAVSAKQLPPLPDQAIYKAVLVHNRPGGINGVGIDRGPGGDAVIELGELVSSGDETSLRMRLNPIEIRSFEVDLVAVIRQAPTDSEKFIIGGLVPLADRVERRVNLERKRYVDTRWEPLELFPLLFSPTDATAAGTAATSDEPPSADIIQRGKRLFFQETFSGNGRTCGTCHPAENNFTLDPAFIASLPPNNPLFVAEFNPNLTALENPPLMHSQRALILENIDGFDQPPVFRATPHNFNGLFTAPYGLSGEIPTLAEFAVGAVAQHFPLTLNRVNGADFRLPSQEEADAMEAFMNTIFAPPDQDFDVDEFVVDDAQRRGRDLFFGPARCSQCHGGPVLALAAPEFGGGNENFDTGVVNLSVDQTPPEECPSCGPLGKREAGGDRRFNVPTLFGVAATGPFFHDNAVQTLREAVAFYDGPEFNQSPGGQAVGGIQLTSSQIDDITSFLEALTTCGNGVADHGEECDDGNRTSGDGCRRDCTIERCGDGILDPGEQCDEGNTVDGDCCSSSCGVDPQEAFCDDGDACTRTDQCDGVGKCVGSDPVLCTGDQCHDAGICDPATGTCADPARSDGTACSDGDPCTIEDACQGGVCRGGAPVLFAGDVTAITQCVESKLQN